MGNSISSSSNTELSSPVPPSSLEDWSAEQVAAAVRSLGAKYEPYADAVLANHVDGSLVAALDGDELEETFEDLDITNRLHRRVLTAKLQSLSNTARDETDGQRQSPAKARKPPQPGSGPMIHQRHEDPASAAATATTGSNSNALVRAPASKTVPSSHSLPATFFQPFDDITRKVLEETESAVYAGVHLVKGDGFLVLSGRFRDIDQPVKRMLLRNEKNQCAYLCNDRTEDYIEEPLWGAGSGCTDGEQGDFVPRIAAHVIKDEGMNRVGTICVLKLEDKIALLEVEGNSGRSGGDPAGLQEEENGPSKDLLLRTLASEAERQMLERKALLERTAALEYQIQMAQHGEQMQREGKARDVLGEQVKQCLSQGRKQLLKPPPSDPGTFSVSEEVTIENDRKFSELPRLPSPPRRVSEGNGSKTNSKKRTAKAADLPYIDTIDKKASNAKDAAPDMTDTASDPIYQVNRATSPSDLQHLPPTFYDKIDAVGGPRPPITKRDLDTVAVVKEMNFDSITPDSDIGRKIKSIVHMVSRLFDFNMGMMVFNDQFHATSIGVS